MMGSKDKLCLQWNDFEENITTSFRELREDREFTDVTLACEDGHRIEAHKVVLASSGPFFRELLKKNKHPHPLIYMSRIKSVDLDAIVDFIYEGEANVLQEELETFLSLAEEFELKGFSRSSGKTALDFPNESFANNYQGRPVVGTNEGTSVKYEVGLRNPSNKAVVIPIQPNEKRTTEINPDTMATVESLIEKLVDGSYACNKCDYMSKNKGHVRQHAERHIEGLEYPCSVCSKVYKTSNNFRVHKRHCQ